jgi:hypothetical protein
LPQLSNPKEWSMNLCKKSHGTGVPLPHKFYLESVEQTGTILSTYLHPPVGFENAWHPSHDST